MTKPEILPDWREFEEQYIRSGVPNQYVVRGIPQVSIFMEQDACRIGIRFETAHSASVIGRGGLSEVDIENVSIEGNKYLQFSTSNHILYRNFYELISEVACDVVDNSIDPIDALRSAVRRWKNLLSGPSVLSEERQRGLFGELWLLEIAIRQCGGDAIKAWLGPESQAHDFRFENTEVEVKTTTLEKRVHRINGASQLEPSAGTSLFVLSLMLVDAGLGGVSLPERVADVVSHLLDDEIALEEFNRKLRMAGYSDTDVEHYTKRYRFRDEPRLVRIHQGTPRITPHVLSLFPEEYASDRILSVSYDADFSGLGQLCNNTSFQNNILLGSGED